MKAAVSTTVGQWDYVACVAGVQPDCYSGCIKCTAKVVANHKDSELGNCVKCQKKQLDENMVSFLASLPNNYYKLLQEIYQLYEDGKLVEVPKAKYCTGDTKLDCRGSNFKGLRNLDLGSVSNLLI